MMKLAVEREKIIISENSETAKKKKKEKNWIDLNHRNENRDTYANISFF